MSFFMQFFQKGRFSVRLISNSLGGVSKQIRRPSEEVSMHRRLQEFGPCFWAVTAGCRYRCDAELCARALQVMRASANADNVLVVTVMEGKMMMKSMEKNSDLG